MLLLRLHRLALRLRPLLPLCFWLGFIAAAVSLFLLLRDNAAPELLSLALGLSIWCLLLHAFIRLFQTIPPPVLPQDSFLERLQGRCQLALYHVLAIAIVILAIAVVSMSLKLVSANLR